MRRSPSNDTKPPCPWLAQAGQIAAVFASIVATRSGCPVVGHGIMAGPASWRRTCGRPSVPVWQRNNPWKGSDILRADSTMGIGRRQYNGVIARKWRNLADAPDLGSGSRKALGVRLPPFAHLRSPSAGFGAAGTRREGVGPQPRGGGG